MAGFNRTSVVVALALPLLDYSDVAGFNRTSVVLKRAGHPLGRRYDYSFNRTIVVLKLEFTKTRLDNILLE